jgi:hypothetical protein
MPKLPTGYRINPQLLAPRAPAAAAKTPNSHYVNVASSSSGSSTTGSSSLDSAAGSSKLGAALAALAGRARSLLQASPVASAYLGMPAAAVTYAQGYASSMQAPQQLIPQLQLALNPGGASQASFNGNGQQFAAGMPVAPSGQQQWQQQQLAGTPLVMAPPATASAGAVGMPAGVPLAFPNVPKESLSILVTDPRNTTGPHPWDVLLFKTNQFNTSKQAYRLGGLGLMLMTDFNKSDPMSDWHVLHKEEPKQRPQVWNLLKDLGSNSGDKQTSSSSSSSSGTATQAAAAGGGAPLFGFGGLMSKNPLLNFGSSGKETTPRFSSLFKLPQLPHAAGASLDAVSVASVPAAAAAGVQPAGSVRLWCTACQAPAYFLSAYGYCGE